MDSAAGRALDVDSAAGRTLDGSAAKPPDGPWAA